MAMVLSSVYIMPLGVALAILFGMSTILEIEELPYKHKSKVYFLSILFVTLLLNIFLKTNVAGWLLILHGGLAVLLFLVLKYWFERKEYRRFSAVSTVISWKKR